MASCMLSPAMEPEQSTRIFMEIGLGEAHGTLGHKLARTTNLLLSA